MSMKIIKKLICVVLVASFCGLSLYSDGSNAPTLEELYPELFVEVETPSLTQAPTPEPTPEPTPAPEPEYFVINMVGDCTLGSDQYNKGTSVGYDTIIDGDFAYPFAETLDYFTDDDFTFANLECTLTESTDATNKSFIFKSPAEYGQIMSLGSVEFVSLGNNHVLDYGEQGYADTKQVMDDLGIGYAGRDEGTIYETESGLKIGVYASSFGNTDDIVAGIKQLRADGAEFIIAALHWGDEGSYDVNATQREQGRAAVDAGADLVYGSHPHTLQEIEEYGGTYIYYSMCNWTFGGNTNPRDKDTIIAKITVMRDVDGTISIVDREHIPCASSGESSYNNYQPVPYEVGSEEYERTLSKIDGTFDGANLTIGYTYSANE